MAELLQTPREVQLDDQIASLVLHFHALPVDRDDRDCPDIGAIGRIVRFR
jgi:hypothetical protein